MSDWYTDTVKAALEIVPVEWEGSLLIKKKVYMRLVKYKDVWGTKFRDSPSDELYGGQAISTHQAQALTEKALREHLDARNIQVQLWKPGDYIIYETVLDQHWCGESESWAKDWGHETHYSSYLEALAVGVVGRNLEGEE